MGDLAKTGFDRTWLDTFPFEQMQFIIVYKVGPNLRIELF